MGFSSLKSPHTLVSTCSPTSTLTLYVRPQGQLSAIFRVFVVQVPPYLGLPNNLRFRLCLIITMSHEDIFNSLIYVSHGTPPPAPLNQYFMLPIVILLKYQVKWNPYKNNWTLLWYNHIINNMYLDGSDLISIFHWFNYMYTLIWSSVKPAK